MHKGITFSASLMCIDWINVGEQLVDLEKNNIDFIHYDIIDGNFAPDFTMGSSIVNLIQEKTNIKSDFHLMVDEPSRVFDAFNVPNDSYFTIHQEACRNLYRDLIYVKQNISNVGVALSPATSIETLEYVIEEVDNVLLMTVSPGFMGQKLVPQVLKKIEQVKSLRENYNLKFKITVDGNVNLENIPNMVSAGADNLVLGSSGLFRKDRSIKESIELIKESLDKIL